MSCPITTTGTTADPVSTTRKGQESTSAWISRHDDAVAAATPSGNKLTTTWKCAMGDRTVTTTRNTGESDAVFKARHIQEYNAAMVDCPPIS